MVGIMSVSFCQINVLQSCCCTFLLGSEIYSWISRTLEGAPHWDPSIAYHSLIQVVMFSLFYYLISSHGFEGQPNVSPPNTPIWQKDCLELRYLRFNRSGRKPSQISLYLTKSRNSWEIRIVINPLCWGSFMAMKKTESWHQDLPAHMTHYLPLVPPYIYLPTADTFRSLKPFSFVLLLLLRFIVSFWRCYISPSSDHSELLIAEASPPR